MVSVEDAYLLVLEDVLLDDVKRVKEFGVLIKPEVFKLFLGDALFALETASDADAIGAERHCTVWIMRGREETVSRT